MVGKLSSCIPLLLALVLAAPEARAELFKWIDEDGNVHYTDKVPSGEQGARIDTENDAGKTSFEQARATRPVIRPYERTARRLHLLDARYLWKKESEINQSSKIGIYHVGKGCASRGAINAPDVFIHHKSLFPSEANLARRINRVIIGLDYEAEHNEKYRLLSRLKKTGGLSLHAEVTAMDLKTCAPNIHSSERLVPVEEISPNRFSRNRVRLQVSWQLRDNRDQNIIYEAQTAGVYNGWNQQDKPNSAIGKAVEDAVLTLFTDSAFIDKLLVEEDRQVAGDMQVASLQPISASGKTANLYVAIDPGTWASNKSPEADIGNILFGDNCAAGKPLPLGIALNQQKWLNPQAERISGSIIGKARPLGYTVNPATAETLAQLQRSTGYSLNARMYKLTYDTCAPALPASSKYKPIDTGAFRKLSRNRLQVWIEWTLKSDRNRDLLYRSSTMGFGGSLVTDTAGAKALADAIGMATEQLFADPEFTSLLAIGDRQLPADQPFAAAQKPPVQGLLLGPNQQATQLLIVTARDPWSAIANSQIGLYAFGSECTPYQQRQWPESLNQHSRHFPNGAELAATQERVARSLGYPARITDQYSAVNLQRKLGAYSLHAEIVGLRFDSCAPDLAENIVFSDRLIAETHFKRHRAIVTVQWKLMGDHESDLLFQKTTEGIADSWLLNSKGEKVLALAVENATMELFATREFVARLTKSPATEDRGFFSDLFSFLETDADDSPATRQSSADYTMKVALMKSQVAQAYSELTRLRIGVTSYYQMQGEWPGSFGELGYSTSMFNQSKTIDYVHLAADGSMIAELKAAFGTDKVITLNPLLDNDRMSANDWKCSSNLQQYYLPQQCDGT